MSEGNTLPPHVHALDLNQLLHSMGGTSSDMEEVLDHLPRLTESQLASLGHKDSVCPICFNTFLAILAEEEMAEAMDSPAHAIEELGVTRLSQEWQCGHIFCRRDITKWVHEGKVTCPTCRRPLAKSHDNEDISDTQRADDDEALERFRQSIQDLLVSGASTSIPDFPTTSGRSDQADSSEFSSMYS